MIYFIRLENKFIKIGYSANPDERLKELQTGSPVKLHLQATMNGCFKTEKGLHELFNHLRMKGEWFRYTDELKMFIRVAKQKPTANIKTLYSESQKLRIDIKANRLGKDHKLSKRLKIYEA